MRLAVDRELNHCLCAAERHDRSLSDLLTPEEQAVADDGLLGCNDCGCPTFYCTNDENYHHVDPEWECFLHGAWAS